MRRCRLNGSDAQHWQGSLSDRMLIAENRCADLFVSTVSPEPGSALQRVRRSGRATVSPGPAAVGGDPWYP